MDGATSRHRLVAGHAHENDALLQLNVTVQPVVKKHHDKESTAGPRPFDQKKLTSLGRRNTRCISVGKKEYQKTELTVIN